MFLYPSQLQRTILGRFERFTSHRVLTVGGRYEIECRKKLDKILTRKAARPTACTEAALEPRGKKATKARTRLKTEK